MVIDILFLLGYCVFKVDNGECVLVILQSGILVDLMFIDVVMFGSVLVIELVCQVWQLLLEIEILFIFGYLCDVIVYEGWLDVGVELLFKLYCINQLVQCIWQMLLGWVYCIELVQMMCECDQVNVSVDVNVMFYVFLVGGSYCQFDGQDVYFDQVGSGSGVSVMIVLEVEFIVEFVSGLCLLVVEDNIDFQ